MPYGFPKHGPSGSEVGVMAAAAIIFFAFYGFDAIATAAEEAKNPDRDLAIGIIGSMVLCVLIYMAVAAVAIGALTYTQFADSPEPLALILREIGQGWAAKDPRRIGGDGAADGHPRLLLRPEPHLLHDGPRRAYPGHTSPEFRPAGRRSGSPCSPRSSCRFVAGIFPLSAIAAVANAGTLAAFIAVCVAMLILRKRDPTPLVFPHALALGGRHRRHRRLRLSVLSLPVTDQVVLRRRSWD